MQRDWLAVNGKADESDPPAFVGDFGFYLPFGYVRRAYLYLERGWGWPEGSGWAEQDARLLDDLDTYYQQFAQVSKSAEQGWFVEDQDEPLSDDIKSYGVRFEDL